MTTGYSKDNLAKTFKEFSASVEQSAHRYGLMGLSESLPIRLYSETITLPLIMISGRYFTILPAPEGWTVDVLDSMLLSMPDNFKIRHSTDGGSGIANQIVNSPDVSLTTEFFENFLNAHFDKVFYCVCGSHEIRAQRDSDGDVDLSFWQHGHSGSMGWKTRLKLAWALVAGKQPYVDMVTLNKQEQKRLADFLNSQEKTA